MFAVSGNHRYHRRGKFPIVVLISDARSMQGFSLGIASVHCRGAHARLATASATMSHLLHDLALSERNALRGKLP